jgi:hypothetical protein
LLSASGFRPSAIGALFIRTDCPSLTFRQFLLYDYESLADFVQDNIKVRRQDHLFRIYHYICTWPGPRSTESHSLAQTSLHAIPLDGATQRSADSESDPKACRTIVRVCPQPLQIEHSHRSRKMAASLLINALEVGMAQKPPAAGESIACPPLDTLI